MIAYVDDFKLLFVLALAVMPFLLLLKTPQRRAGVAAPIED
ncbi:hypothetical protein ACXIVK_37665 [Paraburkholderia caledonica]